MIIARPELFEKLLKHLRSLPSVGPKMSERIAFYLLRLPQSEMDNFLNTLQQTYEQVRPCAICGYWDDQAPCRICQDPERDQSVLCVIENSQDLIAVNRVRNFNWVYHVLGGALSPLDGVGPQDLRIEPLFRRLRAGRVQEVILALNPDIEGETTAQYLTRQIQSLYDDFADRDNIRITRLAQGMPAGGELEYLDEMTLMRAFEGRREVDRV